MEADEILIPPGRLARRDVGLQILDRLLQSDGEIPVQVQRPLEEIPLPDRCFR